MASAFVVVTLRYYRVVRLKRMMPVAKKNHVNLTTEIGIKTVDDTVVIEQQSMQGEE